MFLYDAIKQSEYKAAILLPPQSPWAIIVIKHDWQHYSDEIHSYDKDGNLELIISNCRKENPQQLKLILGEFYNSESWKPYEEPTPRTIKQHFKRVRQSRKREQVDEWDYWFT